jgi:hypothetical protein
VKDKHCYINTNVPVQKNANRIFPVFLRVTELVSGEFSDHDSEYHYRFFPRIHKFNMRKLILFGPDPFFDRLFTVYFVISCLSNIKPNY